jgi:hypothetical protein
MHRMTLPKGHWCDRELLDELLRKMKIGITAIDWLRLAGCSLVDISKTNSEAK